MTMHREYGVEYGEKWQPTEAQTFREVFRSEFYFIWIVSNRYENEVPENVV